MRGFIVISFLLFGTSPMYSQWFSIKGQMAGGSDVFHEQRIDEDFDLIRLEHNGLDSFYVNGLLSQTRESDYRVESLNSGNVDLIINLPLNESLLLETGIGGGFTSFSYFKRDIILSSNWMHGDTLENYIPANNGLPEGCDSLFIAESGISSGLGLQRTPSTNNQIITFRIPIDLKYRLVPNFFNLNVGMTLHLPIYNRQAYRFLEILPDIRHSNDSLSVCSHQVTREVQTNTPNISKVYLTARVGAELQIIPEFSIFLNAGKYLTPINANIMTDEASSDVNIPAKIRPNTFSFGAKYNVGRTEKLKEKQSSYMFPRSVIQE